MQCTEGFVFLIRYPLLAVKIHLYYILRVRFVIKVVFYYLSGGDNDVEWYMEKVRPRSSSVLLTSLDVFYKNFSWLKGLAKFALHSHCVFHHSLNRLCTV